MSFIYSKISQTDLTWLQLKHPHPENTHLISSNSFWKPWSLACMPPPSFWGSMSRRRASGGTEYPFCLPPFMKTKQMCKCCVQMVEWIVFNCSYIHYVSNSWKYMHIGGGSSRIWVLHFFPLASFFCPRYSAKLLLANTYAYVICSWYQYSFKKK